jgi:competence protein ComEC
VAIGSLFPLPVLRETGQEEKPPTWSAAPFVTRHWSFVIAISSIKFSRYPDAMPDSVGTAHRALGPISRRPFVPIAILFALGICIHESIPIRSAGLIVIVAGLAAAASLCIGIRFLCSSLLSLAIVTAGVTAARLEHFQFSSRDIAQFATDEPHLTELELHLPDEPEVVPSPIGQRELPPKQVTTAEVVGIKTWAGWVPASGRLPVQIDEPNPSLDAGQTVRALGMLQRPRAAMNPGEFDWAAYYRQLRILATFTVTRSANCQVMSDPGPSPVSWLRIKVRHLLAEGFTQQHAIDHALLRTILLGDHDPQLRDVQEQFQQIGAGFLLSVSGLHIAVLAWPVFLLCRWLALRPRFSVVFTAGFVVLYSLVSLPSHSGIRSVIICLVVGAAYFSGRTADRAQLVAIGATAMLLWHPLDLFSIGFHLSFAVVTVFVLLLPPCRRWAWLNRNLDEAAARQRPTRLRAAIRWLKSWLLRASLYSLLAWLATLPLVAYHFGQLSVWSLLGGLLLLPIVFLALLAGAAKILFTLLWPLGANPWALVAGWPVQLLQWGVHELARLPGGMLPLAAPPVWLIVAYYLLLLVPLLPPLRWFDGRRRWMLRLAPGIGIVAILWLPLTPPAMAASAPGNLRVTLLSLGAGQCAVVEPPNGEVDFFDAGSTTVSDLTRKIVGPFLRAEDKHHVEDIFLSHGDFDHISAAGEIVEIYHADQVMISYHFRPNAEGNIPDQLLLEKLDALHLRPREIAVGDHFELGGGAAVDCVWPPKGGDLNSNNAGLVLRLTYAGRSILFPADIQDPGFTGVLRHPQLLKSDVLVAAHHGSSEDLTPDFLLAVHADSIISSNAARLTNKQKRFDQMAGKTPLYRTSQYGAITVTISQEGKITISTFKKPRMAFAGTH